VKGQWLYFSGRLKCLDCGKVFDSGHGPRPPSLPHGKRGNYLSRWWKRFLKVFRKIKSYFVFLIQAEYLKLVDSRRSKRSKLGEYFQLKLFYLKAFLKVIF